MLDTAMHWLGYGLCHQLPVRSFFAAGHQLPVCARDTGIYLGFVVSLGLITFLDRGRRRSAMPPAWLLAVGAALVGLMALDGVTEYAGLRTTTNLIRLATGLGMGFALTLFVVPLLAAQLWRSRSSERVLGSPVDGVAWLLALPVTFAFVYWVAPLLGVAYVLAVAAAILMTFTAVNLIVVALIPRFEMRAERLRDLGAPVGIALALAVGEIAAAGVLRLVLLSLVSRV